MDASRSAPGGKTLPFRGENNTRLRARAADFCIQARTYTFSQLLPNFRARVGPRARGDSRLEFGVPGAGLRNQSALQPLLQNLEGGI